MVRSGSPVSVLGLPDLVMVVVKALVVVGEREAVVSCDLEKVRGAGRAEGGYRTLGVESQ
jgi:hypothetical protein